MTGGQCRGALQTGPIMACDDNTPVEQGNYLYIYYICSTHRNKPVIADINLSSFVGVIKGYIFNQGTYAFL